MIATRSGAGPRGLRSRYHPIVRTYFPIAEDEEIELRSSLMAIRDLSTSRLLSCTQTSGVLWQCVQQLASEYATAHLNLSELSFLRGTVVSLAAAASTFQGAYQRSGFAG
jgi:hypothetical protein